MVKYRVRVGNKEFEVDVEEKGGNKFLVTVNGVELEVLVESSEAVTPQAVPTAPKPEAVATTEVAVPKPAEVKVPEGKVVKAPTPGKVIEVKVKVGDEVREDDVVVILESMKMSIEVYAGMSGKVKEILVKQGDFVDLGQPLVVLE